MILIITISNGKLEPLLIEFENKVFSVYFQTTAVEEAVKPPVVPRQDPRLNRDPRLARQKAVAAAASSSLMQPVSLADVKVTVQQPTLIPPQLVKQEPREPVPPPPTSELPVAAEVKKETVPLLDRIKKELEEAAVASQSGAETQPTAASTSVKNSGSAKSSQKRSSTSRDKDSGSSKSKKGHSDKKSPTNKKIATDDKKSPTDKRDKKSGKSPEKKRSPSGKSTRKESSEKKTALEPDKKDEKRSGKRTPTKGVKRSSDASDSKRGSDDRDPGRDSPRNKKARRNDRGSNSPVPRDKDASKGRSERKVDRTKRNYRARGSRGDTPDSETEVRYPGRSRSRSPHRSSRSPRGGSTEGDPRGRRVSDDRVPPYPRGRDMDNSHDRYS